MKYPGAQWRGPVPNRRQGGMVHPLMGIVCHIQEGHEAGTDSWFHDPNAQVSAHFGIALDGHVDQWVDTDDASWAEADGNSRWLSVEFEGYADRAPAPTAEQVRSMGYLIAWAHREYDIPMRISNRVTAKGLGWHGMGGELWGGHLSCPGERVKSARSAMLIKARRIIANA